MRGDVYVKAVCSWGLEEPKASLQRLRSLWAQGKDGQRERKGRALGTETPSRQKGKRLTLSVKKKKYQLSLVHLGEQAAGEEEQVEKLKY